jgi:hypothetical protein
MNIDSKRIAKANVRSLTKPGVQFIALSIGLERLAKAGLVIAALPNQALQLTAR